MAEAVTVDTLSVEVVSNATGATSTLDTVVSKLDQMEKALAQIANTLGNMQSKAGSTSSTLNQMGASAGSAAKSTEKLATASKDAGSSGKSAATGIREIGKAAKETTGHTNSFFSSVVRIAKYRLIRTALRLIVQGFKEGIDRMYEFSQEAGTPFAENMDRLASSVDYLTSSLGAMVAPIINLVTPVLEGLIDTIADLANGIGYIISQVSGDDFVGATKQQKKYKDSLDDTATAAKEAKRQLMGWDELNVINSDSGRGRGGSDNNNENPPWEKGKNLGYALGLWEKEKKKEEKEKNEDDTNSGNRLRSAFAKLLLGEKEPKRQTSSEPEAADIPNPVPVPAYEVSTSPALTSSAFAKLILGDKEGGKATSIAKGVGRSYSGSGRELVPIYTDGELVGYETKDSKTGEYTKSKKLQRFGVSNNGFLTTPLVEGSGALGAFAAWLNPSPGIFSPTPVFGAEFPDDWDYDAWYEENKSNLDDLDTSAKNVSKSIEKIGTTNVSPKNLLDFRQNAVAYTGKEADDTALRVQKIGKTPVSTTNVDNVKKAVKGVGDTADTASKKIEEIATLRTDTSNVMEYRDAVGRIAANTETWYKYLDLIKKLGTLNIESSSNSGSGGSNNINKLTMTYMASGGFPEQGTLALIGENAGETEIIGNVNGRTGVVGGAEITGITEAVESSSATEAALLREQNELLRGILIKSGKVELVPNASAGRWVAQANRAYARATGV